MPKTWTVTVRSRKTAETLDVKGVRGACISTALHNAANIIRRTTCPSEWEVIGIKLDIPS